MIIPTMTAQELRHSMLHAAPTSETSFDPDSSGLNQIAQRAVGRGSFQPPLHATNTQQCRFGTYRNPDPLGTARKSKTFLRRLP